MRKQHSNNYKIIVDILIILCYNCFVVKEKEKLNKNEKINIKEKIYEKYFNNKRK